MEPILSRRPAGGFVGGEGRTSSLFFINTKINHNPSLKHMYLTVLLGLMRKKLNFFKGHALDWCSK
jgi:hypothetical protein